MVLEDVLLIGAQFSKSFTFSGEDNVSECYFHQYVHQNVN